MNHIQHFNEHDVRIHYRLLNHKHLTELRLIRRGMFPACKIVSNVDKFVAVCRQWNGKRNVYVGLRDRRATLRSCGRTEDIIAIQAVALDIDPVREPDTPSTKNELDAAIRLSETIAGWFEETGYVRPWIAVTGNGCCLYFFLPSKRINDGNRLRMTKRIVNFERWVRSNFKTEMEKHNCNIDSMYDLPRIVRVIGTYNIKGKNTTNRPWRLSYWLHKKTQRAVDQRLLGRLQRF